MVGSAPTRWEYYDTIYTERYMGTPAQNQEGYAATDLVAAAAQLQARPLIIHGLNDTNVHLQNSINLIQELQRLDKPFEFLPLPNLNHSYRGDGLVAALTASVDYFTRMLGNPGAVAVTAGQAVASTEATPTSPETPVSEVAQATQTAVPIPDTPAPRMPLEDALPNLEPGDVFQAFYDITQVPRPSGHLDQIRAFLVSFGEGLGLETIVDEAGNVLIRKPAAAGMENRKGVVLQAHMDMVGQNEDGKEFEFTTDPIQAMVDGDYIVADGTTLGADDGIGIAMILAILQSETLQAGPLEALFTVDEESTMTGANALKPELLRGRILINLDWETEGIFTIGAAGGEHINSTSTYPQVTAPTDTPCYTVKVQGLQGGHSGVNINDGLGHATRLLVRLLKGAGEPFGLRLASFSGGTASNAIPRDATAVVFVPTDQVDAFSAYVEEYEATIQAELAATEPDLVVQMETTTSPAQVMAPEFQHTLLDALYGTPQGVVRMSDAVPGLVETSSNLGVVIIQDGQMQLVDYPRSSVDSQLQDIEQAITSVWALAGYPVEITDWYAAWTPDPASPILGLTQSAYQELFGVEPTVSAVHAGLECGAIGGIYPEMDMISIGPTLEKVHSPSERLYIPSVDRLMKLLSEVLQGIPEG